MARLMKGSAGVRAIGTVQTHCIHPSEHVRAKHNNHRDKKFKSKHRIKFFLIGEGVRNIDRKDKKCFIFTFKDFPGVEELYAVQCHFVITELDHANDYFNQVTVAVEPELDSEGQSLLPQLPEQNVVPGEDPFTRE